jgi:predicted RecB family nuclease
MRRIAATASDAPSLDEVDTFLAGPHWVDLYSVVKEQLVTGTSLGLKQLAPFADFSWRDDDPGGDASMLWYERATGDGDSRVRQRHRRRLLEYNEDDVRATAAVRSWLDSADFPALESWGETANGRDRAD